MTIGTLNSRSARNKGDSIKDEIIDSKIDILTLTETWFSKNEDQAVIESVVPNGYSIEHVARPNRKGGGVAVIYKSTLGITVNQPQAVTTFEYIDVSFQHCSNTIRLLVVYRPPSTPSQKFLSEFSKLTDQLNISSGMLLIVGDFNIHVDNQSCKFATDFMTHLDVSNLCQHVTSSTHVNGHTLDLVISRPGELNVSNLRLNNSVESDHSMIVFQTDISKPKTLKQTLRYRKWKDIDIDLLQKDIQECLVLTDEMNVAEMTMTYNNVLSAISDRHAPIIEKCVTIRPSSPWYTPEIHQAKQLRRQYERRWQRSGLTVHFEIFRSQRNKVNKMIEESKTHHFSTKINDAPDSKTVWSICNSLLCRTKCSKLPQHSDESELANKFNSFFTDKIATIRDKIEAEAISRLTSEQFMPQATSCLNEIPCATESMVQKYINSSASKSCCLDPLPTDIVKKCSSVLVPSITKILNKSVTCGDVPNALKMAVVKPLLKKPSLNPELFKNYRPVSNLPYLAKILEKHVDYHFSQYDDINNLRDPMQSAYTNACSTETALLRVMNDILCAVDNKKAAVLTMLDLSAAFDTIDHTLLLLRLENCYGIHGRALQWMQSYLADRKQFISVGGATSENANLQYGVPQGSILGPKAFKRYSCPVSCIIQRHQLQYHIYADDTQIYTYFDVNNPESQEQAIKKIQSCVVEIKCWMMANYLKLNEEKTEIIIIAKKSTHTADSITAVDIGGHEISPVSVVRNLGVMIDSNALMDKQINNICKGSFYMIRNISRIRRFLSSDAAKSLLHCLVTTKLDYCNSLLFGLPQYQLDKLQRVLNSAARVAMRVKKYEHITDTLRSLHWLPICERLEYKILLLTFKSFHNLAPDYLSCLLHHYVPSRNLRSVNRQELVVPKSRLKNYGDRAFVHCAPVLWNRMPIELKLETDVGCFKKSLKTYLFKCAYNL